MEHEHIISQAADYHAGCLEGPARAAVEAHLQGCRDCREIFGRWRLVEPPPGFLERVMADLPPASARPLVEPWTRRLQWWGTLAAAALVVVAFWRPEQEWLDADRSFAWTQNGDHAAGDRHPGMGPQGVRHD
jgi:hypothetical protein